MAAETEEQARDAARAIKVEYEVLPHAVTEAQAMAEGAPEIVKGGNVRKGRATTKGNPDEAMAEADATIEATYSLPVITHVCLEPHGLTAKWDGDDKITAWASTQAVSATAAELAGKFEIPASNVTVLTEVMGGGFGSKFGADVWGSPPPSSPRRPASRSRCSSTASRSTSPAGNRPSATGHVKLGATKDGKIVAMVAETHGTGGSRGGSQFPLPYVYDVPNAVAEPLRRLRQRRQRPGHAGPGPSRRAAPSWKRPWTTWPTSWGSTRWRSGSRTSPRTTSARRSTRPRSRSGPS